jgi:hypothetical protein
VVFEEDVGAVPDSLPAGYEIIESSARAWTLRVHGPLGKFIQSLPGLPVRDLEISEPRLEEILIRYFREEDR